jgi:hypothetical protein
MDRTERELVEMMECAKRDEIFAEHAAFLERAYRIERQRTKRLRERNAHLERSREDMRIQRDRAHKKHKGAVRHAFQCDEGLEKDNERLRAELEAARDKACEMRDKAHRYDAEMAAEIDPFEWEEGERLRMRGSRFVMDEHLKCDCCGGDAAMFPVRDGDPLLCGCSGSVICDEGHAWTHSELPCEHCWERAKLLTDTPKGGA